MSELDHAIEVLEHGRQTHVEWIEYLKETPEFDTEMVGDIEHHEWYLTGYDPAIEALRLVADPNIEAAAKQFHDIIFGADNSLIVAVSAKDMENARSVVAAALTLGDTDEG